MADDSPVLTRESEALAITEALREFAYRWNLTKNGQLREAERLILQAH